MKDVKKGKNILNAIICIFSIKYWRIDRENLIFMHFFYFKDLLKCVKQYVVPKYSMRNDASSNWH